MKLGIVITATLLALISSYGAFADFNDKKPISATIAAACIACLRAAR